MRRTAILVLALFGCGGDGTPADPCKPSGSVSLRDACECRVQRSCARIPQPCVSARYTTSQECAADPAMAASCAAEPDSKDFGAAVVTTCLPLVDEATCDELPDKLAFIALWNQCVRTGRRP